MLSIKYDLQHNRLQKSLGFVKKLRAKRTLEKLENCESTGLVKNAEPSRLSWLSSAQPRYLG